jgi:hypothetical protein
MTEQIIGFLVYANLPSQPRSSRGDSCFQRGLSADDRLVDLILYRLEALASLSGISCKRGELLWQRARQT